jgi:hypothetical protein
MKNRSQVAQYAATMAKELRKMCHEVELNDLAYLFEVAATEAAQVRAATNGSTLEHMSMSLPPA